VSQEDLKELENEEYNRERLAPRCGDLLYLHLSDLRLALDDYKTDKAIEVLDFGCGGSPYRALFPRAHYRRADFGDLRDLDYVIGSDSRVAERSEQFQLVLSTQVLEHVSDPSTYLQECHRLLKKGGTLLCTTHGAFEDHGCPYDFQRWTADGLRVAMEKTGFDVKRVSKLTTGGRALMFFIDRYSWTVKFSRKNWIGLLFWLLLSAVSRRRAVFHALCDQSFRWNRVVDAADPDHVLYLTLLACAQKPG
jgi:SAM-dependent methyltransferase